MGRMYISKRRIYRDYGGSVCRACMNDLTGVHLKRQNCLYAPYPGLCPRCKEDNKNLVAKLKLSGIIRSIFG